MSGSHLQFIGRGRLSAALSAALLISGISGAAIVASSPVMAQAASTPEAAASATRAALTAIMAQTGISPADKLTQVKGAIADAVTGALQGATSAQAEAIVLAVIAGATTIPGITPDVVGAALAQVAVSGEAAAGLAAAVASNAQVAAGFANPGNVALGDTTNLATGAVPIGAPPSNNFSAANQTNSGGNSSPVTTGQGSASIRTNSVSPGTTNVTAASNTIIQ